MAKEIQKKNLSSIQVLKTLNVLLEGNYTMAEILEKLNSKENEPVFNNSTVSKYINTCRFCGIDIIKVHNKYHVIKFPFGLMLDDEEVGLIQTLKEAVTDEMPKKSCQEFQALVDKLNRCANKKITRVEKNQYNTIFEAFEKAINNRKKVRLLFKNRIELVGIPVTILREKGKTFFKVFCKNRLRMIDISRLSAVHITEESFIGYMDEQSVVYNLKGNLAKRYEIREDEKILNSSGGVITITNNSKNLDMLISRLMRYDNLCEIVAPADARQEIKTIIEDTLKNYGVK